MNNFPAINTDRLSLRKISSDDVENIFNIFSNDLVTEYYNFGTFTELSQAEKIVETNNYYYSNPEKGFRWGISLSSDPLKLIGSCGYHATNPTFHSMEIGYELNPDYWNKGYAYEAVRAMISYCYKNNFPFELNRITALTDLESERSINLLSKLGFVEEGILREYGYWKEQHQTARLFSMLKSEWSH